MNVKKIEIVINHQLIKIKIFYLKQDLKLATNLLLLTSWLRAALLGDRRRSETDPGYRKTMPGHQGAAVVPDVKTSHEEIRPETHLLVRTEVSRLIYVG